MATNKSSGKKKTAGSGRRKPSAPRAGFRVDKRRYDDGGKISK